MQQKNVPSAWQKKAAALFPHWSQRNMTQTMFLQMMLRLWYLDVLVRFVISLWISARVSCSNVVRPRLFFLVCAVSAFWKEAFFYWRCLSSCARLVSLYVEPQKRAWFVLRVRQRALCASASASSALSATSSTTRKRAYRTGHTVLGLGEEGKGSGSAWAGRARAGHIRLRSKICPSELAIFEAEKASEEDSASFPFAFLHGHRLMGICISRVDKRRQNLAGIFLARNKL